MTQYQVCKDALLTWGFNHQSWKAIEELSELIDALSKFKTQRASREDVITEIADVQIMMEQLSIYFGEKEVNEERIRKLERLQKRIDEHNHQT